MLEKFSYVLIIGAGAGVPYNFPLGIDLFDNIRNNYGSYVHDFYEKYPGITDREDLGWIDDANNFVDQLKRTNSISIDKYLNINKIFKKQGVHAIAAEIYNAEKMSKLPLHGRKIKNDWYTYLYQKLIQGLNTPEDMLHINENRIAFITFNYDRSLEYFLFENLYGLVKNAGISREKLSQKFSLIPFIHVFGKIGNLPWQSGFYHDNDANFDDNWVKYGEHSCSPLAVSRHASNMINLMYDERKDNQEILEAHKLISNADRILFMGFGFDEQNLQILDLPRLLDNKRVYGTAFEATQNEIKHIKNLLKFKSDDNIYPFNCLMLLREHLI